MKDILKSFLEVSKERIKNPIIGTFLISWVAINWRLIAILIFSNNSIENRIDYAEECYVDISTYFIIPLLVTLLYVIVLPYFTWGVEELIKKSTIERKNNLIKQRIIDYKGKQKIAIEESELENLKAEYRDKANLNKQIEKLRSELDESYKDFELQSNRLEKIKDENDKLRKVNLNNNDVGDTKNLIYQKEYSDFTTSDLYDYFNDIGISIRAFRKFPHQMNEMIKEKFIVQNIIQETKNEDEDFIEFTNKGSFFWKRFVNNVKLN